MATLSLARPAAGRGPPHRATLLFVAAILVGSASGIFLAYESDLPQVSSLENFEPNIITEVYASDGSLLGTFAIERRIVVAFADIPPPAPQRDRGRRGLRLLEAPRRQRAARAGRRLQNLRSGRKGQGFSTLTMQLSRLLFLTPEKTYERKIKEMILAFQIEKSFTKEEIFALYCNQVYFGHGNYGAEATSQFFFSKSIKDLTLAEAALVAGLPQNPGLLAHRARRPRAAAPQPRARPHGRGEVRLLGRGQPRQARAAAPQAAQGPALPGALLPGRGAQVPGARVRQPAHLPGGLRVHTTLDAQTQRAANLALRRGLRRLDRRARGYQPVTASILREDGTFPDPIHLDDWDAPITPGDAVRGVVLAVDRSLAVVQIGPYRARVGPAEIAATGKKVVAEVLPVGAISPPS